MIMNDFRLKVFVSVATHLSFTKAANELYLSQPAISKHIREIEDFYKIRLFNRVGNHIELTREGECFLEHAVKIIESYKELEFEMNRLSETYAGELRIGASSTISQYVIPSIIGRFIQRYPHIKLSLQNGNTSDIEKSLLGGKIDLGIVEGNHCETGINYKSFMNDELVLIAHTTSKFYELDEINIQDLHEFPLVIREYGSGTSEIINNALAKHNLKLSGMNILLTLGSTEGIKSFLRSSQALGIVSIRSVSREIQSGEFKVIECPDLKLERTFHFALKQGSATKNEELFMRFSESYKNQL